MNRTYWVWTSKAKLTDVDHPAGPTRTGMRSGPDGWWTCAPDTQVGDIAFVYRSKSGRVDSDAKTGICFVVEVLCDSFDISQDPNAIGPGWASGCRYQVLAALRTPVSLERLRELRIVGAGSVGVLRASNRISDENANALLDQIAAQGQKVRIPERPEIDGQYRRELDLQAEILARANLPTVLGNLNIRPPKTIRLIPDGDEAANVRAEMPVDQDGRRRRADIVIDEDGPLGRRIIIELKNTTATLKHLEQVLDYRREIERPGLRRPAAVLVATTIPEPVRTAAKKQRVQVATISELGLTSAR